MAKHFQFETLLSLTGSNADYRVAIKPSEEGLVAASIYNKIAKNIGKETLSIDTSAVDEHTESVSNELLKNKGISCCSWFKRSCYSKHSEWDKLPAR